MTRWVQFGTCLYEDTPEFRWYRRRARLIAFRRTIAKLWGVLWAFLKNF